MLKISHRIFFIFFFILKFFQSKFSFGLCKEIKYESDTFNLPDYLGKWYQIARHTTAPIQKGLCPNLSLSINPYKNIRIDFDEILNGEKKTLTGEGKQTKDAFRYKIELHNYFMTKFLEGDYRIVDTDYKKYSLVYSCVDVLFMKFEYVWIMSRNPTLEKDILEKLEKEIKNKFNMEKEDFIFSNQSNDICHK